METVIDGRYGCLRKKIGSEPTAFLCQYGITQDQYNIIQAVRARFPDLIVSSPSYWMQGSLGFQSPKSQTWHHKDYGIRNGDKHAGLAVDFIYGKGDTHPDLLKAWFQLWNEGWNGGLGIGLPSYVRADGGASVHLHVDLSPSGRRRWIEIGSGYTYEDVSEKDKEWNATLNNVRYYYNYFGNGTPAKTGLERSSGGSIIPGAVTGAAIGGIMGKSVLSTVLGALGGAAVGRVFDDWRSRVGI